MIDQYILQEAVIFDNAYSQVEQTAESYYDLLDDAYTAMLTNAGANIGEHTIRYRAQVIDRNIIPPLSGWIVGVEYSRRQPFN